jgi:hypothetical protein
MSVVSAPCLHLTRLSSRARSALLPRRGSQASCTRKFPAPVPTLRTLLGIHFAVWQLCPSGPILACAGARSEVPFAPPKKAAARFAAGKGVGWRSSMAEHLFCKQVVRGSSPLVSSSFFSETRNESGGLPEWPKGADCKSAGYAFDGSNPSPSTLLLVVSPLHRERHHERPAGVAQLVERQPSKLNVAGSNPVSRSHASPT